MGVVLDKCPPLLPISPTQHIQSSNTGHIGIGSIPCRTKNKHVAGTGDVNMAHSKLFDEFFRWVPVFTKISVRLCDFPATRTLGSEQLQLVKQTKVWSMVLEKQASQQSTKKWKWYTNFSDTNRAEIGRYAAIIVTTCMLVKIGGGAKIGTAHSQR